MEFFGGLLHGEDDALHIVGRVGGGEEACTPFPTVDAPAD